MRQGLDLLKNIAIEKQELYCFRTYYGGCLLPEADCLSIFKPLIDQPHGFKQFHQLFINGYHLIL